MAQGGLTMINQLLPSIYLKSANTWNTYFILLLYGCSSAKNVKPEPPKHVSPKIKTDLWSRFIKVTRHANDDSGYLAEKAIRDAREQEKDYVTHVVGKLLEYIIKVDKSAMDLVHREQGECWKSGQR